MTRVVGKFLFAFCALALLATGLQTEPADAFPGAAWFEPDTVWTQNFHDPTVFLDNGTYYAFSGQHGGNYLPALSSTDLSTWTTRTQWSNPSQYGSSDPWLNDAMPVTPSWGTYVGGHPHLQRELWAPGVAKIGNQYVMFYALRVSWYGRFCLGVATSPNPQGPYTDSGSQLHCDADPNGSIDPEPFVDSDGTPYLIWKSEGVPGSAPTKIWVRELAPNGTSFAAGSYKTQLLQTELGWEGNVIENPSMVKYQGKYLLFYSANEWKSANYATGYAVCQSITGPCTRGSVNPLLSSTSTQLGPGGADAFVDKFGNLQLMYHYWNAPYTNYPNWPSCDTNNDGECTEFGQRRMRTRQVWLNSSNKVVLSQPAPSVPPVPTVGTVLATGDFDGDNKDDVAIGAPGEDVGNLANAGAVTVAYGSWQGVSAAGNQLWTQQAAIPGVAEPNDEFGAAVAVGDFDNDGRDDLVIGSPGEDIGATNSAGYIHVLYGTNNGLSTAGSQAFAQGQVAGLVEAGDRFGAALAAGDFNGDGYDDIAVGAPGENIGSLSDAGVINIIYGSSNGLTTAGNRAFTQSQAGVGGDEPNDQFGAALASGDFNNDNKDDLAVGAPGEDIGQINSAGAIGVMYGSNVGLRTSGNRLFFQSGGVVGAPEVGDRFGAALAAGDLTGDNNDDLVIGAPDEDEGNMVNSGIIHVMLGSSTGLKTSGNTWHSQSGAIAGAAEPGDRFGATLAIARINAGNKADLVVGAPGEDIGSIGDAGLVNVIMGGNGGLDMAGNHNVYSGPFPGAAEAGDGLGAAVALGDFNGDGYADLLVGSPGEDVGAIADAGAVAVVRGTSGGTSTANGQLLVQGQGGLAGAAEAGDAFG